MKTLYESIFDIDKNIDDDSAIRLSSKWAPMTFTSRIGPVELFKFLKDFNWSQIETSNHHIKWIDYYVMRPYNKKNIQLYMEKLFTTILSAMTWEEVMSTLSTNNKSIKKFELIDLRPDVKRLTFYTTYGTVLLMTFKKI